MARSGSLDQFDRSKYKQPETVAEPWESMVLRDSLDATEIAWQMSGARGLAVLRLPGGRKQTVHLMFDRSDAEGDQLIQMISVCGPASDSELWRKSLVMNATMTSATMALAQIAGVENLVVLRTQLARTADREEILVGVTTVGQMADRLEIELTGGKDIQ